MILNPKSSYITAYYDCEAHLQFLGRILEHKNIYDPMIYFPVLRDLALTVYQIDTDFNFKTEDMDIIHKLRHKIKLDNKDKNKKVFKSVLERHFAEFGIDTENIAVYFDQSDELIGSSMYEMYLAECIESKLISQGNEPPASFYLATRLTKLLPKLSNRLIKNVPNEFILNLKVDKFIPNKSDSLRNMYRKDTNHLKIFNSDDLPYNTFLFRLLLIQHELTLLKWFVQDYYPNIIKPNILDHYYLQRIVSIRFDSVLSSLGTFKVHLPERFKALNKKSKTNLDSILQKYVSDPSSKLKEYRNTLHYNLKGQNFTDMFFSNNVSKLDTTMLLQDMNHITEAINLFIDTDDIRNKIDWKYLLQSFVKYANRLPKE